MRDDRGSARFQRYAVCLRRYAVRHRRCAVCLCCCRSIGTLLPKSAAERLGCPDAVTTGAGATLIEARYRNFRRWITSVTSVRSCRQVLTRDFRRVRLWFHHVYFQSARGCHGGRIGGFVERLWWVGQHALRRRCHAGVDTDLVDRRRVDWRFGHQHAERWCAEHTGVLTSNHATHDAHREERKAWHRL